MGWYDACAASVVEQLFDNIDVDAWRKHHALEVERDRDVVAVSFFYPGTGQRTMFAEAGAFMTEENAVLVYAIGGREDSCCDFGDD